MRIEELLQELLKKEIELGTILPVLTSISVNLEQTAVPS